jgi:hypothetical protein
MSKISRTALARAISRVDAMDLQQQENLADEIFKLQPNMLGTVLALPKMGVPADRMGFPIKMLLVCFQSMKKSGVVWPKISEKDQSCQLERWISSVKMGNDLNPSLNMYSTQVYIDAHPEKDLLAYVTTSMAQWLADQPAQESDRYVMMAVQNLVNCIAQVDLPEGSHPAT